MATQVFLVSDQPTTHRGSNSAKLDTTASGWVVAGTSTSRGAGTAATSNTATVTGPTLGVEVQSVGTPFEWITPPVDADVTISGNITANIWASENNMSANVAINVVIDKMAATDQAITQIVKSTRVTEVAVTTRAVNNFTTGMLAADYTDVSLNKGDRLRIRVFGDDAGTMASGFTFNVGYAGTTAGVDGDTFVTFTETFGFQTTDPTGTQLFLLDAASSVSTASVDREAWTSRGGSAATDSTTPVTGWTTPIQLSDTAGGTVVDWFTRPLQAFTLSGLVKANLRADTGDSATNATNGLQIARVDGDGTNPVVWGYANHAPDATLSPNGEILTTGEAAYTAYVAGDDLAVSDGQRLRIRWMFDDTANAAMGAFGTIDTWYNGPTGGASGDSFVTLEQTVSEFSAGPATSFAFPRAEPLEGLLDPDPWGTGWA